MKSLCLVMIVKNEAHVIQRCLDSVRPLITSWAISDTGSTDNTKELIRASLKDVPGELYEDPWVNFGHNRTLAIRRAQGKADYLLLLNADETLEMHEEFRDKLIDDMHLIRFTGNLDYHFPAIVSDRHDWEYKGPTHEYISSPISVTRSKLPQATLTHHFDGSNRTVRLERESTLLIDALRTDPENSRHMFYLAQTLHEMGRLDEAMDWYAKRTLFGGFDEEVFCSLYQLARTQQQVGKLSWPDLLQSYLKAYQYRPSRLEPLLHVARHYRENCEYELGYLFSRPVVDTPYPDDILFIERNIYEYELPTEYAICCYWTGRHEEAIRVNDQILAHPNLPENFRQSALRNRQLSQEILDGGQPTDN